MVRQIVVLSGHVSSGKSTLSKLLTERFGVIVFKTKDLLKTLNPSIELSRGAMQAYGEDLDRRTGGAWVRDGLSKFMRDDSACDENAVLVVDAVRIPEQIASIRKAFGDRVTHIHLDAPRRDLARRYKGAGHKGIKELASYRKVLENPTEAKVREREHRCG